MITITNAIREFCQDEEAATAVEYGVIIALIIGVCIATIATFGQTVKEVLYDESAESIAGALDG